MDSPTDLLSVLAEWRRLTEREAQAILNENWKQVAEQQQRKAQLQEAIACAPNPTGPEAGDNLAAIVNQLVLLETNNRDVLTAKRQSRQVELQRVNETQRNLQGVRRTYGEPHSHRWHSYS